MSKKLVYVTWPTDHKTGPHVVVSEGDKVKILFEDGEIAIVPSSWAEEVPPELEPSRLYYFWDDVKDYDFASTGRDANRHWQHYEPVHTRWDELSERERDHFKQYIDVHFENYVDEHFDWICSMDLAKKLYKRAYMLITGEGHP